MARLFIVFAGILLVACARNAPRENVTITDIDSVIDVQVKLLSERRYKLEKRAAIGTESTSVILNPDSAGWEKELAVFRQLEIAGRPSNRNRYKVIDTEDTNSNLRVRSFEAENTGGERSTPVPFIRYYYLDDLSDVRRIESEYYEDNPLYTSKRDLVLEFEVFGGTSTLRRYEVEGFQKIQMADSVHFSVAAEVIF